MKTKDISANYGIDQNSFDGWLQRSSNIPFKQGMMGGISIENETDVEEAVNQFQQYQAEQAELAESKKADAEREAQEKQLAAEKKQQALASMLVTSGFNFDGYKITKYSGYISGDDVVQIERGTNSFFSEVTDVGESLMASLTDIRRNALAELKEAAHDLGCNAVIGVDFDYLTLDPETAHSGGGTLYLPYVFGVTANGNAVIIEGD
jgi:uncharacterized protein YbjQ (UPF0145 family)